MDAVPLLEGERGLFSSQDIYDLMACLQELIDETSNKEVTCVAEKLRNVRSALARNLAEALIREGTKGTENKLRRSTPY